MYERFTDRARRVMQLANQEALRLNSAFVSSEHILLGIVKEGGGIAATLTSDTPDLLRRIRENYGPVLPNEKDDLLTDRLPLSGLATAVVEQAIEEAHKLGNNWVGTEHLLLAVVFVENTESKRIANLIGITYEIVRAKLRELNNPKPEPVPEFAEKMLTIMLGHERERCARLIEMMELKCDGLIGPVVAKDREMIITAIRSLK